MVHPLVVHWSRQMPLVATGPNLPCLVVLYPPLVVPSWSTGGPWWSLGGPGGYLVVVIMPCLVIIPVVR